MCSNIRKGLSKIYFESFKGEVGGGREYSPVVPHSKLQSDNYENQTKSSFAAPPPT